MFSFYVGFWGFFLGNEGRKVFMCLGFSRIFFLGGGCLVLGYIYFFQFLVLSVYERFLVFKELVFRSLEVFERVFFLDGVVFYSNDLERQKWGLVGEEVRQLYISLIEEFEAGMRIFLIFSINGLLFVYFSELGVIIYIYNIFLGLRGWFIWG